MSYGDKITSRDDAKRLVKQFSTFSSDAIAELTSDLESLINREIVETGEILLHEYQNKLLCIDNSVVGAELDFDTVDLIKGTLGNMRENVEGWCSDAFATETVDNVGETEYEEKVYYEKTGQEEEEIAVGSHQEKIGTKKVKVGSHRERTGTRTVENPKKKWWKIFTPKYIEEDVYETVDDYKDEDVYKMVTDYKKVMRDIFEQRVEKIEKFTVAVSTLQTGLISKLRQKLDEGVDDAVDYAKEQVDMMKEQFTDMFDELDQIIEEKYTELEKCAFDQQEKEAELQKNRKLLEWIEENEREIAGILDL